jgi:hypothetical protein
MSGRRKRPESPGNGWRAVGQVAEASWANADELGAVPAKGSRLSAGAPVR